MSKAREQLGCRALALAEPMSLPPAPTSIEHLSARLLASRSPLGVRVHKQTDLSLLETNRLDLLGLGFLADEELAVMDLLLCTPSIAMRDQGGGQIVLATCASTSQGPVRAVANAQVAPGRPPELLNLDVQVDPIDPEEDLVDLVLEVANWHIQFPSPDRAPAALSEAWALIGSPERQGLAATPRDWQKRVTALASVLGTKTILSANGTSALAMNVARLKHKFLLAGASSEEESLKLGPVSMVGPHRSTYPDLERALVAALVARIGEEANSNRTVLKPGDQFFHRKINNGGGRDYFGAPLAGPCQHGLAAFVRFHSAPQAERGMAAIYENFESAMLQHCRHFPNCNVYAVIYPSP